MKRYVKYQQLPWSERTMPKLEELRFETCLSFLTENNPMGSTVNTADYSTLVDYCSRKGKVLPETEDIEHLRRSTRELMMIDWEQDVDFLTQKEYSFLVKLLLNDGIADLESASEAEATVMMREKLWCDLEINEGSPAVRLDEALIKPLSERIIRSEHLACRSKISLFDAMISTALYVWGFLEGTSATDRFIESVLNGIASEDNLKTAERYIKAEYDYIENGIGFSLVNEALTIPDDWSMNIVQPSMDAIMMSIHAATGFPQEEMVISEKMALVLQDILRPEYEISEAVLTLQLMIKQGAPWEAIQEAFSSMIYILPTDYMLQTLREMVHKTSKWDCPWTSLSGSDNSHKCSLAGSKSYLN